MREDEKFIVTTDPTELHAVKSAMEAKGLKSSDASITWVPKNTVQVEGEHAEALLKLLEALDDLDDVQKVDANFDIDFSQLAS